MRNHYLHHGTALRILISILQELEFDDWNDEYTDIVQSNSNSFSSRLVAIADVKWTSRADLIAVSSNFESTRQDS